jgi:hypothetical protein
VGLAAGQASFNRGVSLASAWPGASDGSRNG